MLFIFGLRRQLVVLGTRYLPCRIGHSATHRLIQRTSWLVVFFIQLVPVRVTRTLVCRRCGSRTHLSKSQAELFNQPAVPPPAQPHQVPPPLTPGLAGWYPDPADQSKNRWWNGTTWTRTVQSANPRDAGS
jgi:hypothetical protein